MWLIFSILLPVLSVVNFPHKLSQFCQFQLKLSQFQLELSQFCQMLTSLSCRVLFPESTAFMLRASSILSFNHPPLTFVCDPQATTTDESNEKQHKKHQNQIHLIQKSQSKGKPKQKLSNPETMILF